MRIVLNHLLLNISSPESRFVYLELTSFISFYDAANISVHRVTGDEIADI
jgi:hypothetical protein